MSKCQACNAPLNRFAKELKCEYCGVSFSSEKALLTSLRIETVDEAAEIIVQKQTRLPFVWSEIFSTAKDDQAEIQINLFQGESEKIHGNRHLGRFFFKVEPLRPRAVPRIEITFKIDTKGSLQITAVNSETKTSQTYEGISLDVL
ncbi:MAG TPA: Hsp70 family protein [Pyrinomonadaceae bacterium]|nr:Hsp70 family protein [Pyrinomonadaceae bacterium]